MAENNELRIGLVGAGKMATALAKGFIQRGLVGSNQVMASDPMDGARTTFAQNVGSPAVASNTDVARHAHVLFIAVKPGQVAGALVEMREHLSHRPLIISIAAGISLSKLEAGLPAGAKVIRAMPNTPALVGQSAIAYALGTSATSAESHLAQKLFSAVGLAFEVKENLMDAVTGLSGSGPAYVYMIIEAMSDGGVAQGLPRDVATQLAAQTVLGSARMVLETGLHPGSLKDMVTSPGGTTIEGIHELEKAGVRGAFMNAVRAASEKSRKLGQ
jgi:pyrroline-5-carboxylate reductase